MALIKCPECEKEFSETASVCPQCGYKKRNQEIKNQIKENQKNNLKKYWWLILLMGLGGGLLTLLQNL